MSVSGLEEFDLFLDRALGACRDVVEESTARIQARAQANLRSKTHGTGATAAAIGKRTHIGYTEIVGTVFQGDVTHEGHTHFEDADKARNLGIFLEYGTVHQGPRPYLGPAGVEEAFVFLSNLERAVEKAANGS